MNNTVQKQAPPGLPQKKAPRMLHVNEVRLAGRLTHDPQIRSAIGDKMIMHFNLAVNHSYRDASGQRRQSVTFVPITVWNRLATHSTRRLAKGSAIYLEGRLRSDRWKTTDGDVRTALKVQASRLQAITKTNGRYLKRAAAEPLAA